jgi:hypothetical protein
MSTVVVIGPPGLRFFNAQRTYCKGVVVLYASVAGLEFRIK